MKKLKSIRELVSRLLHARRFVFYTLLLGLLLRLAWVGAWHNEQIIGDYHELNDCAKLLAEGKGYIRANGQPTAYRPIGYSFSLSLLYRVFGPHDIAGKLANVVYSMGILAGAYALGRYVFSEKTARAGLLLMACFPNQIAYNSLLATEPLYTMLFIGALVVTFNPDPSRWQGVLLGALWGAACYVKPIVPALIPLFFLCLWAVRKNWKWAARQTAIGALVALVMLSPWLIRNRLTFGHWSISNEKGMVLLVGANEHATGNYFRAPIIAKLLPQALEGGQKEYDINRQAQQLALQYIREHPFAWFKLGFKKLYFMYRHDVEGIWHTLNGIEPKVPFVVWKTLSVGGNLYYAAVMFCAAAYLVVCFRRHELFVVPNLLFLFVAYYTAIVFALHGLPRYHFSIMPILVLFAAQFLKQSTVAEGSPTPEPATAAVE